MPTPQELAKIVRDLNARFVVVSNRQPFIHEWQNGTVVCKQPAGGLTAALDPVMRAVGGLWVAHGNGDADKTVVDARRCVAVPPGARRYTLKRVWLERDLEKLYYHGLANQALWPLCHTVFRRPVFEPSQWAAYLAVNRLFAEAVAEEIGNEDALVFIQDYHFAPLGRLLKERCPKIRTAHFWHIPWPSPDTIGVFPWRNELLEGLLDNDLLGFQLPQHASNFIASAAQYLGAACSGSRLSYLGGDTQVGAFPIGVDSARIESIAGSPEVSRQISALRTQLNLRNCFVGVSVDRLDYTKGIPERLRAIDWLLERNREYHGRFVFIQVAAPSRLGVNGYQAEETRASELAAQINRKYGRQGWQPVVLLREHCLPERIYALYRLADVCIVGSLHDGMNLVAKEFVSARADGGGALVLSSFAGAAHELKDAIAVNPYAAEDFAEAIAFALQMSPDETQLRMRRLRRAVAQNTVYDWASSIVERASRTSASHAPLTTPFPIEMPQLSETLAQPAPSLQTGASA